MPIPQLIDSLARRSSSLPPLVSRPDTPVPWIEEPVHSPTPPAPVQEPENPSLSVSLLRTSPITALSSDISRSPPSLIRLCPFSLKDLAGGSHWLENYLPLTTRPPKTPLDKDFDGRLYFPLVHHKVYKALAEPRSLYEDAWEAFIGRESPRLKRKYSDLVDLTEDEELDSQRHLDLRHQPLQEYQQWKLNTRQKRRRITKKYPPPFHTKT